MFWLLPNGIERVHLNFHFRLYTALTAKHCRTHYTSLRRNEKKRNIQTKKCFVCDLLISNEFNANVPSKLIINIGISTAMNW